MCNAYNHSAKCNCGWGGKNHYQDFNSHAKNIAFFLKNEYGSYVNPNATCPVCGQNVFFYKSENGGRVFFDELRPPWPKHPCTDLNSRNVILLKESFSNKISLRKDDWIPIIIEKDIEKSSSFYYITRIDKDKVHRLEVIVYDYHFEETLMADVLNLICFINDTCCQINSFSISMEKEVSFKIEISKKMCARFFEM